MLLSVDGFLSIDDFLPYTPNNIRRRCGVPLLRTTRKHKAKWKKARKRAFFRSLLYRVNWWELIDKYIANNQVDLFKGYANVKDLAALGECTYDQYQEITKQSAHDSTKLRVTSDHYMLETISTLD